MTGVAGGSCDIIYTISEGCGGTVTAKQAITITPAASVASVSGTSPICINATATYTANSVVLGGGAGAWSSSNTAIATVNASTGVVTGVSNGTCNIIYTITGGCGGTATSQQAITVNPNAAIGSVTGTSPLCVSATATYAANSVVLGGGTGGWSSSNTAIATVNSSTGVVTAVAEGTCNIIYTITDGCGGTMTEQQALTVNPVSSIGSVTGTTPLCLGSTATYTANTVVLGGGTGTWSSSNTTVATVNSATGVVTAVAAGSCNIIYTITGGCGGTVSSHQALTVNATASVGSVTGTTPVCAGATATYSVSSVVLGGGTGSWSSSNTAIATVDASTGVVSGVASGSCNIIYTVTGGCGGTVTTEQAVTILPNALLTLSSASGTDNQSVCINSAITSITYAVSGGGTNATASNLPTGITGA
ncbi:MAG: Ig-like domain-containing protein, partial [Methanothrix sp.]|nr:Ig-like domain-containing protein [Methanothrix sp.]